MVDYSNFRVGMAVNCGDAEKKQRLIESLLEVEQLSSEIRLWVEGRPFEDTVKGIIGGLQRSIAPSVHSGNTVSWNFWLSPLLSVVYRHLPYIFSISPRSLGCLPGDTTPPTPTGFVLPQSFGLRGDEPPHSSPHQYFEDLTMQIQPVRFKEVNFWTILRYTMIAFGIIVFLLILPHIVTFLLIDPVAAILFLVASAGFAFSVRRIR
jgi:hypothetical protein